jgi:hypothetical protein
MVLDKHDNCMGIEINKKAARDARKILEERYGSRHKRWKIEEGNALDKDKLPALAKHKKHDEPDTTIIHEIFGPIASSEGGPRVIIALRDRIRALHPNGNIKVTPSKAGTFITPIQLETSHRERGWCVTNKLILAKNFPIKQAALTQTCKYIEWFDLEHGAQAQLRQEHALRYVIDKKGTLNALAAFIYIDMGVKDMDRRAPRCASFPYGDDRLTANTSTSSITSNANSESRAANWTNPIFILPKPLRVHAGDTIYIKTLADSSTDRSHYTFSIHRESLQTDPLTVITVGHDELYPDFPARGAQPARAHTEGKAATTRTKRNKRKRHKKVMTIMEPSPSTSMDGYFEWTHLAIKPAGGRSAGNGLFAKTQIAKGTMIPILGRMSSEFILPAHTRSHFYKSDKTLGSVYIDGHPDIQPHKGIGSRGLSIALMANEPDRASKANAYFACGYLIIQKNLKAGDEITVIYGQLGTQEHVHRREEVGYELIEDEDIDTLTHTHNMPDPSHRKWILNKYLRHCSYVQTEPNISFGSEGAIRGIPNIGNTCHLGAVIQALIPAWNHKGTHHHLPRELQLVVHHALGKVASLSERIRALECLIDYLRQNPNTAALYPEEGEQEGLHQTYMTLMEGISHPEANMSNITRASTMICGRHDCSPSRTYQTHNHLLLDLPDKDDVIPLAQLIQHIDRDISLDANTRCSACGHKGHLKQTWRTHPTGNTVVIQTIPRSKPNGHGLARISMDPPIEGLRIGDSPHEYTLQSVVGFTGDENGGHFFTISRRNGEYYLLNDSKTTKLTNPTQSIHGLKHIVMLVYMRRQRGWEENKKKRKSVGEKEHPTEGLHNRRDLNTYARHNTKRHQQEQPHREDTGHANPTRTPPHTTGNSLQTQDDTRGHPDHAHGKGGEAVAAETGERRADTDTNPGQAENPPERNTNNRRDANPRRSHSTTREEQIRRTETTLRYIKERHEIQHLGLDGIINGDTIIHGQEKTWEARRLAPRSIQIILINDKPIIADKIMGAPTKVYIPDYNISDQGKTYKVCKTIFGETDIEISKMQKGDTKGDNYALVIAILVEIITNTEPPEDKTYKINELHDHLKEHTTKNTKIPPFPSVKVTRNQTKETATPPTPHHTKAPNITDDDDDDFLDYVDSIEKEINLMKEIREREFMNEPPDPPAQQEDNFRKTPDYHSNTSLKEILTNLYNTHRNTQGQPNKTPTRFFPDIEQRVRQLLHLNQTINQHILLIKQGDTWQSENTHHSKLGATNTTKQAYLEGGNTWINTASNATHEIDSCYSATQTKKPTRIAIIVEDNKQNNEKIQKHSAKHPGIHTYTINTYGPGSTTFKQEGTKNPWTLGTTETNTCAMKLLMIQNWPETAQNLKRIKTQMKKDELDKSDNVPRQYHRNDHYQYPSLSFYRHTPRLPTNYIDKEDRIAHALGILPADIALRLSLAGHKNLVMNKELKDKISKILINTSIEAYRRYEQWMKRDLYGGL